MTRPVYRYRSTRSPADGGRPRNDDRPVDPVAVQRACWGERVPLTASGRREAVRRLSGLPTNEIARRLDLSWRTVQRHQAAIRRERDGG